MTRTHAWLGLMALAIAGGACLTCHAPQADQQPLRVTELLAVLPWLVLASGPNPSIDPALQGEGVTCLACHWTEAGAIGVTRAVQDPHATTVAPLGAVGARCHQLPRVLC